MFWDPIEAGQSASFATRAFRGRVFGLAFSPDGQTFATGSFDTTVKLWDAATHQELAVLQGRAGREHRRVAGDPSLSPTRPTADTFATAGEDNQGQGSSTGLRGRPPPR